jgi:hypothetical protein
LFGGQMSSPGGKAFAPVRAALPGFHPREAQIRLPRV